MEHLQILAEMDTTSLWPAMNLLLATYLAIDLVYRQRAALTLPRGSINRGLAVSLLVVNVLILLLQVVAAIGWVPALRSGVYLFGVTWLTIGAGLMFYRLIMAPLQPVR